MENVAEARKRLFTLAIIAVLTFLFWQSVFVYPIRLLVVLAHEVGHGLAALLSGGEVVSVKIAAIEAGVTTTAGGSRFLVLNGGYLGSAIFGALLLWLGQFRKALRITLFLLSAGLLMIVVLYAGSLFTILYCLAAALVLGYSALKAPPWVGALLLDILGASSSLYVLFDIWQDVVGYSLFGGTMVGIGGVSQTDAQVLADSYLLPAIVWGLLWLVGSLALDAWVLRRQFRLAFKSTAPVA